MPPALPVVVYFPRWRPPDLLHECPHHHDQPILRGNIQPNRCRPRPLVRLSRSAPVRCLTYGTPPRGATARLARYRGSTQRPRNSIAWVVARGLGSAASPNSYTRFVLNVATRLIRDKKSISCFLLDRPIFSSSLNSMSSTTRMRRNLSSIVRPTLPIPIIGGTGKKSPATPVLTSATSNTIDLEVRVEDLKSKLN